MLHDRNKWGCFAPAMVEIHGGFRIDGTNSPDAINDGNTNIIKSVVRDNAGIFTVTLAEWIPVGQLPDDILIPTIVNTASDISPVKTVDCKLVTDSWSKATRSFQIVCILIGDTGASAYFDAVPADPDDNTWVCFKLEGSVLEIGKDGNGGV